MNHFRWKGLMTMTSSDALQSALELWESGCDNFLRKHSHSDTKLTDLFAHYWRNVEYVRWKVFKAYSSSPSSSPCAPSCIFKSEILFFSLLFIFDLHDDDLMPRNERAKNCFANANLSPEIGSNFHWQWSCLIDATFLERKTRKINKP